MSDFANRLRNAEDYGNGHLEKLHIAAADEIDRLTIALSEADQREKDARRVALGEAAKVAEDKAQAWSTPKGSEIDACLDIAAAIRALQSEER